MKNLHTTEQVESIKSRVQSVQRNNPRNWGSLELAQALAHCSAGIDMALGDIRPKRRFVGRLIGAVIKPLVLRDDKPLRPNAPSVSEILVPNPQSVESERARLIAQIDRFAAARTHCSTHPHAWFGRMTADEWAVLMYKHLDHHLRQFSA